MKDCGTPKVLEIKCPGEVVLLHKVIVTPDMGDETTFPPKVGLYKNVLLQYATTGNIYLYSSDGIPTKIEDATDIARLEQMIEDEIEDRIEGDEALHGEIVDEAEARDAADQEIWTEIETIEAASDVVDVVGTYAELQAYDTSTLHDKDLIKVLQDETRDDAITYYRWSTTTETFSYVGEEGPYYTQSQTDTLLDGKQDTLIAGSNIQIAADGKTISATDTTYTAGANVQISNENVISATDTTYTAGTNVQISANNEISATDTTYSAGTGLNLNGTQFSVDTTVIAEKTDIPTVNDATLTIQQNGTTVQTFTANQASNATANITVPTDTSDLTNGAGFITSAALPTKTSDLTNDGSDGTSTYVEASDLAGYQEKLIAGSNIQIAADGKTISATDTTYSDFTGATSSVAGAHGLVPAPAVGDEDKVLKGDGTWGAAAAPYTAGTGIDITSNVISADTTVLATQSDLSGKQDTLTAGSNIQINNNTISATDTTYSNFVGTDGQTAGVAGLVPAPATTDAGEYLKADGTWDTPPGVTYTAGTNIQINGTVISATDTTYSDFTGATSSAAGAHGLVPAPAAGDDGKVLHGDGTWKNTTAKLVEMSYGEANAWAKFIAAYNAGSIVYCRASSNADPSSGSQTRKAFMAYVNNATSPTSVEFQYVRSVSSKTDSQQCDQVFVYTLTNSNGGTWSVTSRNMAAKVNVDSTLTKTFSNGANASMTLSAKAMTGATGSAAGTAGYVPAPAATDNTKFLKGDGTWGTPTDTTYSDFVGTDGSAVGTHGLVPAPATTDVNKYLSSDGSWETINIPDNSPVEFYWYQNDLCSENATWTQVDPLDVELTYLSHPIIVYNYSSYAYESVVAIDTAANIIEAVAVDLITREPRLVTYKFDESVTFKWVRTETSIPNITMTSTDPGEGGSLAAGNFIYVYDAGA